MRYLNDEELQLASRFLFLSMAIIVIEQDILHIQQGPFKIKKPYFDLLTRMISIATNERKNLRINMQNKNMKVIMLNKNKSFTSFLFLCQRREEERNYFNPVIRKKVKLIIQELIHKSLNFVEVNY